MQILKKQSNEQKMQEESNTFEHTKNHAEK